MSEPTQNGDNKDLFKLDQEVSLDDLVGEGKKYASAEEALKSVPHSQKHISLLERQLAELREEVEKRSTYDKVLEEIRARSGSQDQGAEGGDQGDSGTPDLATLVKNTAAEELPKLFEAMTRQQREKANVDSVTDALVQRFGSAEKAREVLAQKAKELGVTGDYLRNLAATSPKAVLAYFPQSNGERVTTGSVNTAALGDTTIKPDSYAFYEKMRKENPTLYFNPKTQLEMQRAAIKARAEGREF